MTIIQIPVVLLIIKPSPSMLIFKLDWGSSHANFPGRATGRHPMAPRLHGDDALFAFIAIPVGIRSI